MKVNNVYVGNNIEVLKTFPDNSIDSVVTDPPYGLGKEPNAIEVLQSWITNGYHEVKGKGFMGKEWDAFVPQPNFWKEIYRVLKPGGYVLSFAGTRTYDWMVMAVCLAGFEIRDMIAWLYGSGFPKSHDISKAIDKMMGAEREVVGSYKGAVQNNDSVGGGFNASKDADEHGRTTVNITAPSTDEAKQWQGWGTALKPALEPIVMARKPLDGTVAQNVLKWGVGGINIDECRVATDDDIGARYDSSFQEGNSQFVSETATKSGKRMSIKKPNNINLGRFPANVIHDGSDEVVSLFPETNPSSSGGISSGRNFGQNYDDESIKKLPRTGHDDNGGSASRFFYTAKASQEERNFGLSGFEDKVSEHNSGGIGRKTSVEKRIHMSGTNAPKMKNIHPTVKPIELMRYLVKLVTPKNGICLDLYLGSGTTAIACEMEKFSWIGIELMPEYAEIAKSRIGAVKDYEATLDTKTIIKESIKEDKEKELGIQNIFDLLGE
ncbi:MAG: DNA methyltransferase [Acholeplasmataceae bacterium]